MTRAWGNRTVRRAVALALALTACAAFAAPIGASTQVGRPAGALPLQRPVVGLTATPTGGGYWRVASDGGVFTSGDAKFYGSTGAMRLNQPIVGMAATRSGHGYWLVARDGGIFSFGDARFYGSTGAIRLNQPIVGMAATRDGRGYWMVARDGGIFSFGTARFHGSLGRIRLVQPIVGMAPSRTGRGYVLAAADGGVFTFGDAKFYGSAAKSCPDAGTVGIAATPQAVGYWIGLANARTYAFSATSTAPKIVLSKADTVARDLFNRLNDERLARGRAPLQWDCALSGYAKGWSTQMASAGFHHSNITSLLNDGRLSWVGENIAWARGAGVASSTMHTMWMQSQGHRDNMMSPTYNVVGIGVYCAPDGTLWATQSFGRLSSTGPGAPAPTAPASPFVRRDGGGPAC